MGNSFDSNVLRIGIIQQGRIIEEKLLQRPAVVTVGTNPQCTVVLPGPAGPEQVRLFEPRGNTYALFFDDDVDGRLSLGPRVLDFAGLRKEQLARKEGSAWVVPIPEGTKGRLTIGDCTVLFQFVARPQEAKPVMPASLRMPWTQRIDMPLLAILTLSFVLQGGMAGGLHVWWEHTGQYLERPTRRKELLRPLIVEVEAKKKQEEPAQAPEREVPKPPQEVVEAPKPEPKPEPKPKAVEPTPEVVQVEPQMAERVRNTSLTPDQYVKARAKVQNTTILRHIGSMGPGADGSLQDTLARGVKESDIDQAFDTGGARVATMDDRAEFRGRPKRVDEGKAYTTVSKGEMVKPEVKVVSSGEKSETAVKVSVKEGALGPPVGTGQLDGTKVKQVFAKRKKAIQGCYEKTLRVKAGTEGKIKIRFTIGPAGRITEISVVENTTGSSDLGDCIQQAVQSWRFDPPDNGSVTFTYPFILSKMN